MKVAIVWQRFLPCHLARLAAAGAALERAGATLAPVEVAAQDGTYGFPVDPGRPGAAERALVEGNYHAHPAGVIAARVLDRLGRERPDVVLCPATAFPEGIAAVRHRLRSGGRVAIMDDAWEHTDRRGRLTRLVKRLIHRNVDAAFIPAPSHAAYYRSLGFPDDRIVCGVDVVDNGFFAARADAARAGAAARRAALGLPARHFLFVGRLLPRKGLGVLLEAYEAYRSRAAAPWGLAIVGGGPEEEMVRRRASRLPGIVLAGARHGDELGERYGLAGALVVPSESDPWALVVNEGAAAALPLIVSRGCGAAATLVEEGGNGLTFEPGDAAALAGALGRIASLPDERLALMGRRSREIVAAWSPERFAAGLLSILGVPRRPPAGPVADLLTKWWKGRVSVH